MAKKTPKKPPSRKVAARVATTREKHRRPHSRPLPGLEDRAIKPLEEVAEEYAEIRDARVELTAREHALKVHALQLMKRYEKTIYRHDGIEITVVPGEDDIKVRVKKADDESADDAPDPDAGDDAPADIGAEFADERAAAVNAPDDEVRS
jgi:hypothetical protein